MRRNLIFLLGFFMSFLFFPKINDCLPSEGEFTKIESRRIPLSNAVEFYYAAQTGFAARMLLLKVK